ncbi:MAG: cytochrome c biogenesis protein CcsA [Myxococcales bacterium]|nr:cytochrome c biogenesis protein CcsA [Myxococcales bacterium]USN50701.1 MAG: cytochrome c biogenesis protein CcsA [Myxococcales bacterium]
MDSTTLYNLSTGGYVASLALFAVHLVKARKLIIKTGLIVVACSFLIQTGGMLLRWIEAGHLEVNATELAIGQKLSGWSWFVVFTQHPPWSNLYEIMIYMSWGIVMVTLFAEIKWQFAWLRQTGIILALMTLGIAALTDASIKPLVPALKSWWIMIHVISASVAYAAGSIAAFISLFALMKDEKRVPRKKFAAFSMLLMAVLLFCLGGGGHLLTEQSYFVKLLAHAGDSIVNVFDLANNSAAYLTPMPNAGWLIIFAVLVHVFGAASLLLSPSKKQVNSIFLLSLLSTVAVFGNMIFHDMRRTTIVLEDSLSHHLSPAGPWFISFKSHVWSFSLLVLVLLLECFIAYFLLYSEKITNKLAAVEKLEGAAYKAISLSFFLMSIVLITGALWAHYAWGRYWAWDPKETGALAIWLIYAIYLHARRTAGLFGPFSSVLGVLGFFVIIIGFLGVNLGLFSDGLHTYGNG